MWHHGGLFQLSIVLLCTSWTSNLSYATPLISEVYGGNEKCFRYIVPPEDDAHLVFLAIAAEEDDAVEEYFVDMVGKFTKEQLNDKPPPLPELPAEINSKMKKTDGATKTYLRVQKPNRPVLRHQMLQYGRPLVIRNIVATAANSGQGTDVPLGGYSICFKNTANWKEEIDLHVIFDMVLVSGDEDEDEAEIEAQKRKVVRKEHLTPLEMNLDECIDAAEDILDEFKYMERRERRMRQTADSTNRRVKYFSYLSVGILLSVTWLQVTYLKNYFKKKKLM